MSSVPCAPTWRTIMRVSLRRRWACRLMPALFACAWAQAWAVPTCTVASTATLSFGSMVALASTGDISANTGTTFFVNCTADVVTTPSLYSASTRALVSGAGSLAFSLSTVAPGGAELPTAPPGTPLGIAKDGTNQTVPLYGKLLAGNFRSLHSGFYTTSITLTVVY